MGRNTGKSRGFRDLDGVLILDKSAGITSNRALQQVRTLFRARKAGHCGSLDPLATGVLPVCFGEATKFSNYLLDAYKTYRAVCELGRTTTTGDTEGDLLETREVDVSEAQIRDVLEDYIGEIEQVPPMYSALKHDGKRLYQLARAGKQVERSARKVQIRTLEFQSFDGRFLAFDVSCSKGTYIRTLAEDIGAALGCGAHIASLHRARVEPFSDQDAFSYERLQTLAEQGMERLEAVLLPISAALMQFTELVLKDSDSRDIRHGKTLRTAPASSAGIYRLVAADGRFIGLGEVMPDGSLTSKRLMNTAR